MKNIVKINITILFWLLITMGTNAQKNYLSFNHIGSQHGLSDMKVNAIVQDKMGFIWIGTDFGLNRYDGRNFVHYKNDVNNEFSLSSNIIRSLFLDVEGNLWIGTEKGINLHEGISGKIYRLENTAFSESKISSVITDSRDILLIGTSDKGVYISNRKELIKKVKSRQKIQFINLNYNFGLSDNKIRALHRDYSGNIWIGTDNGLDYYNAAGLAIENDLMNESVFRFFKNKKVTTIGSSIIDDEETILIGTSSNVFYFSLKDTIINAVFTDKGNKRFITKFVIQNDSVVWIGSLNGFKKFNLLSKKLESFKMDSDDDGSIASSVILTVFVDNNDLVWVGVADAGLDVTYTGEKMITNYLFKNFSLEKGLRASGFVEDKERNIIISTDNGIVKYDKKNNQMTNLVQFPWITKGEDPKIIQKILFDKEGALWVATFGKGLLKYDKNFKLVKRYKNNPLNKNSLSSDYIYTIYIDQSDSMYIGTRSGLNILNPKNDSFQLYSGNKKTTKSLTNPFITTITKGPKGNIWLGSWGGGIYKFDRSTNSFENYRFTADKDKLNKDNTINKILVQNDSIFWLATSNGIKSFNVKTQQIINYTVEDGLPSRDINEIVFSDNLLWISYSSGISILNTETEKLVNLDKSSDIFISGFRRQNSLSYSNGDIYFGGNDGFISINKHMEFKQKENYKTYMSDFYIYGNQAAGKSDFDKPFYLSDTIIISTSDKVIGFEISTPCFQNPEKVRYQYMLKGLNDNYIEMHESEHNIGFSNLDQGVYQLFVKTKNPLASYSKSEKIVTLIVEPQIWQTSWFKILATFFILFLIYITYQARLRNIKQQKSTLELLVKEKTKALENTMLDLLNQKEMLRKINDQLIEKQGEVVQQSEELKNVSEKLRISNVSLEKTVTERTKELKVALGKAEEARLLISAFLENMSHEVRTPMNAISGFAQLLTQYDLPSEKSSHYATVIIENIESLLDLINNIMDASKLHSGQYKLNEVPFSLNNLFKSIYEKLISEKKHENSLVDFSLKLSELKDLKLYTDQSALYKVVYNLSENALKYTEKGSVEVGFRLNNTNMPDNQKLDNHLYKIDKKGKLNLEIFVKDTGVGIEENEQYQIFDFFRKVETQDEKLYRGSGLSLAIVNEIVKLLEAEITLESKKNSGTYITLKIPLVRKK